MPKLIKQKHGYPNPIFVHEEHSLLAVKDRAKSSSTNSQILGRNGEKGISVFLNRYLPNCLRTVNGHFITPEGKLSPEIDIMVIDSRYPLIAQNEDGSVIAMLHSVIATIEVKLSLSKREIEMITKNDKVIRNLSSEFFPELWFGAIAQTAIAYSTSLKLASIEQHYFKNYRKNEPSTVLTSLRVHNSEQFTDEGPIGAMFWLECGDDPCVSTTLAPLSDFYYSLVQNAYYTLSARNFDFRQLGEHMMEYFSWGTYPCKNRGK